MNEYYIVIKWEAGKFTIETAKSLVAAMKAFTLKQEFGNILDLMQKSYLLSIENKQKMWRLFINIISSYGGYSLCEPSEVVKRETRALLRQISFGKDTIIFANGCWTVNLLNERIVMPLYELIINRNFRYMLSDLKQQPDSKKFFKNLKILESFLEDVGVDGSLISFYTDFQEFHEEFRDFVGLKCTPKSLAWDDDKFFVI